MTIQYERLLVGNNSQWRIITSEYRCVLLGLNVEFLLGLLYVIFL